MSTFKFHATSWRSGIVEVDGVNISKGVSGFTFAADASQAPEVELRLAVHHGNDIEAEDVIIRIPEATRDALIRLGWTPPKVDL